MIDRSPAPETIRPGRLLLRTEGRATSTRGTRWRRRPGSGKRFTEVLRGFSPDDWAAPTRCADWSAHDVVRHLWRLQRDRRGHWPG
jgi:hypothetical protein